MKYATLATYAPFIRIIRRDLNIPNSLEITIKFRPFTGKVIGGFTRWYGDSAYIEIDNRASHFWIIGTLMHELKHVQQYASGRLQQTWITATKRRRGYWAAIWEGQQMLFETASSNIKKNKAYLNQPWEVEAYAYQEEKFRLFPRGKLPRMFIGQVGGVRLYKLAG